ncbi:hypothetical protein [Dyella sp.]|uniref:hypothetical protein n=1 Tax=Dyella sp. TaxID=1869338 RepID=UPI0028425538|nr:hypothetical protein [Dyella sp.]MDR3445951.1 hypothetical protein [Dyella sp.]
MSALPIFLSRTAPKSWEGCEPQTNDERRAAWAARFYSGGHHRKKPRFRVKPRIRIVND